MTYSKYEKALGLSAERRKKTFNWMLALKERAELGRVGSEDNSLFKRKEFLDFLAPRR